LTLRAALAELSDSTPALESHALAPISDAETRHTLSPLEASELESLEQRYEVIQTTVFEGIGILLEIRDRRLYRAGYRTFEDYCRERWGFVASRARQLIAAAEIASRVESVTNVTVANEGQARALARFDDDLQPAIMRATKAHADATGKPVTAGLVEGVGRVITEAATTGHVDIGDGLNAGEKAYGEKYAQAVSPEQTRTWQDYAWVAANVEITVRTEDLSWSHHCEVAS
jgi:hypothetical protein